MTTDDYVARVLAEAPPLNDEQRIRLAELLRPIRGKQVDEEIHRVVVLGSERHAQSLLCPTQGVLPHQTKTALTT
jgi:hypothetical protein